MTKPQIPLRLPRPQAIVRSGLVTALSRALCGPRCLNRARGVAVVGTKRGCWAGLCESALELGVVGGPFSLHAYRRSRVDTLHISRIPLFAYTTPPPI